MANTVLNQLFRHMSWANQKVFLKLAELPEEALGFYGWNEEWTVGKIANHIVFAQGRFLTRLQKLPATEEIEFPMTSAGMKDLAAKALENDKQLLELVDMPDEMLTFVRYGQEVQFTSTSVLASCIHHSVEHRAQIADILAINKMDVINLDEMDHWSFERAHRAK